MVEELERKLQETTSELDRVETYGTDVSEAHKELQKRCSELLDSSKVRNITKNVTFLGR